MARTYKQPKQRSLLGGNAAKGRAGPSHGDHLQSDTNGHSTGPNPQQLEAIKSTQGPVLIIAGPGSGKTETLVRRIVHLVETGKARPEDLLVVTFTEKAARELAMRISMRFAEAGIQANQNEMYLGTFHSVFLRLLKDHVRDTKIERDCTQLDQFDQQYFLYLRINEFKDIDDIDLVMGNRSRWKQSEELIKQLNQVCEEAVDIDRLEQADEPALRALTHCFRRYQELLAEEKSLDFSSIQLRMLQLLEQHPGVLAELQQKFSYLMVDEYQDTNTIQERILEMLAAKHQNLCVVGDDDQSLYRFRGATVQNILDFSNLFQGADCKSVTLKTNYRSHPDIIRFYAHWMDRQEWTGGTRPFRLKKEIEDSGKEFPDTPAVVRLSAADAEPGSSSTWNDEVFQFLRALEQNQEDWDWNQVAFLFRSVKHERVVDLAHFLENNDIPVYSPRSNMFFERDEIRLMIGALIFLFPQFREVRQRGGFKQKKIWKYYDEQCLGAFETEIAKPENVELRDWAQRTAALHETLDHNTDYAFSGLFYQLLQFPLFSRHLDGNVLEGTGEGRTARNLAIFSGLLKKCERFHNIAVLTPSQLDFNLIDLFNRFLRFLFDGGINEYEDESDYAPKGCVSFMTIHQAKGLEFPIVVCGSMEANPREQRSRLDDLLEKGKYLSRERFEPVEKIKFFDFFRLFYTAFSRAQNLLVLAARDRRGGAKAPSKQFKDFFYEVPDWKDPEFEMDRLSFEKIRSTELKREYSFTSDIAAYENCAEQYRFYRALGFEPSRTAPMLFGTLVHRTLEDVHRAVLNNEEHMINRGTIEIWFAHNYNTLSKSTGASLGQREQNTALRHVLNYCDRQNGDWSRIKEAEYEVSLDKNQYILKGNVDLVLGEGDTVEIVDFKTERKPDPGQSPEQLKRYRRQLEIYAHLVQGRMEKKVSRMRLHYTGERDGDPYVTFEMDGQKIDRTIAYVDSIVQRIEKNDFRMEKRPLHLCGNCDMKGYCDKKWKSEAGQ